ncbi:hypothetical protein TKK_0018286 [Trichogramma kaykai]
MKDFNIPYYSLSYKFLYFCGLWPFQSLLTSLFNKTLIMCTILSVFIPQLVKLYKLRHILMVFLLSLSSDLYYVHIVSKFICAILCKKQIAKVLEKIHQDFEIHKNDYLAVIKAYSAKAYKINMAYTVYMLNAAFVFSAFPLTLHLLDIAFPRNQTRLQEKPRFIDYGVEQLNNNYLLIILHGYTTDTLGIAIIIGCDTLFVAFTHHVCALFSIIHKKLRETLNEQVLKKRNYDQDALYDELAQIVQLHNNTLDFIVTLESAFSTLNLVTIGCATLPLTVAGQQVLMSKSNISEWIRFSLFGGGEVIHLIYCNWPSQQIRNHSQLVHEACYDSQWYDEKLPDKCKQLLKLMMLRSQKESILTAGKIYYLGLANFAAIMKACMSYFTVLSSLI